MNVLSEGYVGYSQICNLIADWTVMLKESEGGNSGTQITSKKRKSFDSSLSESEGVTLNKIILKKPKQQKTEGREEGREEGGEEGEKNKVEINKLIRETVRNTIVQKFDPKKADTIFEKADYSQSQWLDFMINDSQWRTLLYDLSENFTDCLMLNFAIQVSTF